MRYMMASNDFIGLFVFFHLPTSFIYQYYIFISFWPSRKYWRFFFNIFLILFFCFFCFSFLTHIEVAWEASPPAKQLISQTWVLLAESVRRSKEAKRKSEQPVSFIPTASDGLCRFLFTATYSTALAWLLCYQFSINLPHNRRVRAPVLILPDSVTLSWED